MVDIPFDPRFKTKVEVIEDRGGGEYTWFTIAREVYSSPANSLEYQVKGIKNKLRAPSFKYLSRHKGGDFFRIYSPKEGEYYIMEVKKKTVLSDQITEEELLQQTEDLLCKQ